MQQYQVTNWAGKQRTVAPGIVRVGLVVLALLCMLQPGQAAPRDLCAICGRDWIRSPSRIRFTLMLGKHPEQILVCSPFCMCERLERYAGREYKIVAPQIIDYATLDDENPRWTLLEKATFLDGVKGNPQRANEPLVAAFTRKKVAQERQAELGGELKDWDALRQECVKLAQDYQPHEPPSQHDPNRRPR
jgi:hypothetical protein